MPRRMVIQTIGTVVSLILAFIALDFTHNLLEINFVNLANVLSKYTQFFIAIVAVAIMIETGFSYYDSSKEYVGGTRVLYLLLAFAHIIFGPLALLVSVLNIELHPLLLAITVGIPLLLFFWSQQPNWEKAKE